MVDFTVVLELRHIIHRGLQSKNDPKLVIHLDSSRRHLMPDSCPLDTGVEIVTHFALIVPVELLPKKRGDILRFYRVNSTSDKGLIQRLEVRLSLENDVGGVFCLHDGPMIRKAVTFEEGAIPLSQDIQYLMQVFHPDSVREGLSLLEVADFNKGIAF